MNLTLGLIGLFIIIGFVILIWVKIIKDLIGTLIYFSGGIVFVCLLGIIFYVAYTDYTIGKLFKDYLLNIEQRKLLDPFKMVYDGWNAAMSQTGIGQSINDLIDIKWDLHKLIDWFKSLKFW